MNCNNDKGRKIMNHKILNCNDGEGCEIAAMVYT